MVTAGAQETCAWIARWVGTRSVPVDWEDEQMAPAVTPTPMRASRAEHFPKLKPSP